MFSAASWVLKKKKGIHLFKKQINVKKLFTGFPPLCLYLTTFNEHPFKILFSSFLSLSYTKPQKFGKISLQ